MALHISKMLALVVVLCVTSCSTIDRGKGRTKAVSSDREYHAYSDIPFATVAAKTLKADVFVPYHKTKTHQFPTVLLIHGGGWENGNKEQMTPIAERLARAGFAVVNISYRFAPAYTWPAQIEDCRAALQWTKDHATQYGFDLKHLGTFGYSAGAHLALMLGYENPSDIRAVVDGAGPTDFTAISEAPLVQQLMGFPMKVSPESYRAASPYFLVNDKTPATFVYYGEHDWIVEPVQNTKLLKALKDHEIPHDSYQAFFGHIATFLFDEKENELAIQFLKRHI